MDFLFEKYSICNRKIVIESPLDAGDFDCNTSIFQIYAPGSVEVSFTKSSFTIYTPNYWVFADWVSQLAIVVEFFDESCITR